MANIMIASVARATWRNPAMTAIRNDAPINDSNNNKVPIRPVTRIRSVPSRFECRVPVAIVPVGYPLGKWGEAPRRPSSEVTYWDHWGERRGVPD